MTGHTRSKQRRKPGKPYPSFPLTAHNNGRWCKKIRGKVHFFGVWADPEGALAQYRRAASDLHAGRQPVTATIATGVTSVKDVANGFLTCQQQRVEANEITPRWFGGCLRTIEHFAAYAGAGRLVSDLRPEDFQQCRQQLLSRGLGG